MKNLLQRFLKDEQGENRISISTPLRCWPLKDTPTSENQGHDKQNEENHKHNLSYAGGGTRSGGANGQAGV